jgi:predicted house-cleaning NTP pyrophosphatase (Maf/HAM1 superfamily)
VVADWDPQIGLTQIEVIPSAFPEDLDKSLSAFEYVLQTATAKAMAVYRKEIDNTEKGEPALIIAADTVVVGQFGEILEKPRSEVEHIGMLKMLRDTGIHKVYTAVACMAPLASAKDPGYALETHVEETTVRFDPNSKIRQTRCLKDSNHAQSPTNFYLPTSERGRELTKREDMVFKAWAPFWLRRSKELMTTSLVYPSELPYSLSKRS